MNTPVTVSPDEAVPTWIVPPDVRKQLLEIAKGGVTTVEAAKKADLPAREVLRYMYLLRDANAVHLRDTEGGQGVEWKTGRAPRSSR